MKLLRLQILEADTCGGLLNGLNVPFRGGEIDTAAFSPLCLIGPNGTGKSQVLQILAEIFQAIFHEYIPDEEKGIPNGNIFFELEYLIALPDGSPVQLKVYRRRARGRQGGGFVFEKEVNGFYTLMEDRQEIVSLLPQKNCRLYLRG